MTIKVLAIENIDFLTPREIEVLRLIGKGRSRNEFGRGGYVPWGRRVEGVGCTSGAGADQFPG
ncbi:MAG: hypothetical protein L0219_20010 [Phycisphaerales bacterium]|nr:hypothetical protein [Phycisphaerales bacterium]MCI0675542.1 hypothetical protein [Phycisphaerales bacterium]